MKLKKILAVMLMALFCTVLLSGQAFAAEDASDDTEAVEVETLSYASVTEDIFSWLNENIDAEAMGLDDPATEANEGASMLWFGFTVATLVLGAIFLIFGFASWKLILRVTMFFGGFIGAFVGYSYLFTYILNTTLDTNVIGVCRFFLNAPIVQCVVAVLGALLCFALTRYVFRIALFGGTIVATAAIMPMFIQLPPFVPIIVGAVLGYFVAFPLAKPIFTILSSALSGVLISFAACELLLYGFIAASFEPANVLDPDEAAYLEFLFLIIAAAVAGASVLIHFIVAIVKAVKRKKRNKYIFDLAREDAKALREARAKSDFVAPLPLEGKALKVRIKGEEMTLREREKQLYLEHVAAKKKAKEEKEIEKLRRLISQAERRFERKHPEEVAGKATLAALEAPVDAEEIEFREVPEAAEVAEVAEVAEAEEIEVAETVEEAEVAEIGEVTEVAETVEVAEVEEETVKPAPVTAPAPVYEVAETVEEDVAEEEFIPEPPKPEKRKMTVSRDCSDCSACDLRPYCKSSKAKACRPEYCATCNARNVCKARLDK